MLLLTPPIPEFVGPAETERAEVSDSEKDPSGDNTCLRR